MSLRFQQELKSLDISVIHKGYILLPCYIIITLAPYLCVKGVIDHLVAAEPLGGVDPGYHEDVGLAWVNVHVFCLHVLADLVGTQSLNCYQGFVVAKTPFLIDN